MMGIRVTGKCLQSPGLLLGTLLLTVACSGQGQQQYRAPSTASESQNAAELISASWPASTRQLPTTSGDIYLSNLNSQIQVLDKRIATPQQNPARVSLAGLLYHRFQLLGRIEDAERARELLQQAFEQEWLDPAGMIAYARILAGLHEFDAAQSVINSAEARGGAAADISRARQQLMDSRQLPKIAAEPDAGMVQAGDYLAAVQSSARLLEQGQLFEASELLRSAQDLYRDSNPFPLAWIHLQQGVAFLRYQQYEQARLFFAAAHERLPQYYLATEHLAETEALLGNWQRAAELYRQVAMQTDQPAFWHGLQLAETELGNAEVAEQAARIADNNYRQLLEEYPLTFADHAVGYFIDTGREHRALQLAELNFANRQDVYAHLTLAEALAANGRDQQACAQVNELRQAGLAPPEISLATESLSACRP